MIYNLEFQTSHNQFYLSDKYPEGTTGGDFWDNDSYTTHLAIADGIIGIGTESYGDIKGRLLIYDSEPRSTIYEDYDHIVEGGIKIKSGVLQVLNCPDSKVEFEVSLPKGGYRVRVLISGLSGFSSDSYDEFLDDFYKIEIWPDTIMQRKVVK